MTVTTRKHSGLLAWAEIDVKYYYYIIIQDDCSRQVW